MPKPTAPHRLSTEVSGTAPAAAAPGLQARLETDSGELRQPLRLALSTHLVRPGSRRREIVREGAGAKGCPGKAWRGVRAAGAPFQPGQVRLEGLCFQFRSAAWASGGPGQRVGGAPA